MLAIMLPVAAAVAIGVAIPCAQSTPDGGSYGNGPWLFVMLGVMGLALAVFDRTPAYDPKLSAKANFMVVMFGPVAARISYAVIGGAFLGIGIGLFLA
jgi:hypothetical protein